MKLTGTNRPITYTTHPSRERIQKTFTPGKGTKKQDCLRPLCGSQPTNPLLEEPTKQQHHNNNTTDVVTTDFPTPAQRARGGARVTAVIAWGKRPVPSRTRKLRPTAPMVLHPGGCGRVGHRRNTINGRGPPPPGGGPPAFKPKKPPDDSGGQFWHMPKNHGKTLGIPLTGGTLGIPLNGQLFWPSALRGRNSPARVWIPTDH